MAYINDLRAEKEKFLSTRSALFTAINKANNLKGKINSAASSFGEGVRGAGKDLDESKFAEHSENMGAVATSLSTIAEYCTEQIEILSEQIRAEEARLAAALPKTESDSPELPDSKHPVDLRFKEAMLD